MGGARAAVGVGGGGCCACLLQTYGGSEGEQQAGAVDARAPGAVLHTLKRVTLTKEVPWRRRYGRYSDPPFDWGAGSSGSSQAADR